MPAIYINDGDLEGAIQLFKQISASKNKDARRHDSFTAPAELRHKAEFIARSKHRQNERRRKQRQEAARLNYEKRG